MTRTLALFSWVCLFGSTLFSESAPQTLIPLSSAPGVESYRPVIHDPIREPWRWRSEDALSSLHVLCMDDESDGTLWAGCVGGLVSYDGAQVTSVPFDADFLSQITLEHEEPWVPALLVLRDGRLLALVDRTLLLRSEGEWSVVIQDVGHPDRAMLKQAEDGSIWLLNQDSVWQIGEDLSFPSVVMRSEIPGKLLSFCLDRSADVWVAGKTDRQQVRLVHIPVQDGVPGAPSEWEDFLSPVMEKVPDIRMVAGFDDLIWLADFMTVSGLQAFDVEHGLWRPELSGVMDVAFYDLMTCRDGSIWASTEGGLLHVTPSLDRTLYSREILPLPMDALKLFEARDGRLWVIGRNGEIYSIHTVSGEWKTYEGLNFQCETDDGILWFTSETQQHAISWDSRSDEWLSYGVDAGMLEWCGALFVSSHGLVWASGSYEDRAAISVYDGTGWTRRQHPEFAQWVEPNAVMEAEDGTLWFGAGGRRVLSETDGSGGALQYRVNEDLSVELLQHHAPPDFPYYITSFEQGPHGGIWVGSTQVHFYDGVSPAAQPLPYLGGDNSAEMVLDKMQNLWVAKENLGVCRWDGSSWQVFTQKDGLAGLRVSNLLQLNDGSLLAASNKGISRYDGAMWTSSVYPSGFEMVKRRSGMRQSKDGSVWLNFTAQEEQSAQMIVSQNPRSRTLRHRAEKNPPETQVVECLKRVSPPGNTHVSWSAKDLWSRTPKDQLQYSWRLNGGEWSVVSTEAGRSFLNLPTGEYVLEVRSRDRAFNLDPTPARAEFVVIPPVWRQGWFVALMSTLMGVILFLLWRWIRVREYRLRQQQELMEAFLIRKQEEREAELRGELDTLAESYRQLEEQLKQDRKPLIPPEKPENERDQEFMAQVMAVLDEKYSDWEFRREDLAVALHMSLRTFQRRLKAASGFTPKEVINEFRMTRAAELLQHTSLSITDIAFRTGHDDSANFSRWFKKVYALTPTQYRAKNRSRM
jgi:AraC-like DNA-binding protein/ligand-binding sensor domain-containing protein